MNVLAIDIGVSNVRILASGQREPKKFDSGPKMTPRQLVAAVKKLARGWSYDVVSLGYPGTVRRNQPDAEPHNLAQGCWVKFDYRTAFGCPVKISNDAALQALGSYRGGKLLFLSLGTGLGATLVVDGIVVPMELAHLPYRQATFEDYVGARALERDGKKNWRMQVGDVITRLVAALAPDDVVIGGRNVHVLDGLPSGCRTGGNASALIGGFRMWQLGAGRPNPTATVSAGIETDVDVCALSLTRRDGRTNHTRSL